MKLTEKPTVMFDNLNDVEFLYDALDVLMDHAHSCVDGCESIVPGSYEEKLYDAINNCGRFHSCLYEGLNLGQRKRQARKQKAIKISDEQIIGA